MRRRLEFITGLLLLSWLPLHGQEWQWGQRGGSSSNGINVMPYEDVVDMDSDPNGNVYVLSIIESSGSPTIAGQALTTYGNRDILLSSFDCEGRIRWKKVFGGYVDDQPVAMKVSPQGHIYITGVINVHLGTTAFDTDTIMPSPYAKTMFLIQYDTGGIFQWLRMPQPDTVTTGNANRYRTIDISADSSGNVYWYCILNEGLLPGGGNHVIPKIGPYILRYDVTGNLLGYIPLEMDATHQTNFSSRMTRDPRNGRFYIAGQYNSGTLSIGGQAITKRAFAGCFDSLGRFKWVGVSHTNTNTYILDRVQVDNESNIYVTGGTNHNNGFNGMTFYNTLNAGASFPFVMKLDSNGNTVWGINAQSQTLCEGRTAALRNGVLMIGGEYGNRVIFGTDTLMNTASVTGQDCYIALINTSGGSIIKLDTLTGAGFYDKITSMTSDRFGNFYVGGSFESELKTGDDTLQSAGGNTDFFIARYGNDDCRCLSPEAAFTYQYTAGFKDIGVNYSGTQADSVWWDFGDGSGSSLLHPSHTYADTGIYRICVYAWSSCGRDSFCADVHITGPSLIWEEGAATHPRVYPNPSSGQIFIGNMHGPSSYRLYHATGQLQIQGMLHSPTGELDIRELPSGIYLLELEEGTGIKTRLKILKH